ncbi:unnamed protein product, partial [Prorocentrum cordatum]
MKEYMPALALVVLQMAVPIVCSQFAQRYERYKIQSQIACITLKRNFRFQLATLWVTVVCARMASTIQEQLNTVVEHPVQIFEILRIAVPEVSVFFLNYIMAQMAVTTPLLLWQPLWTSPPKPQLLDAITESIHGKKSAPGDGATRQNDQHKARGEEPPEQKSDTKGDLEKACPQAAEISKHPRVCPDLPLECTKLGILLVLSLLYSVIAPALMPACMLFFAVAFLIYTWLCLSVWSMDFDCQGNCWFEIFHTTMMGLVLGTVSFTALAFGAGEHGEFSALIVLCVLEVFAWYGIRKHFALPAHFMSLEDASALDEKCGDATHMLDKQYYMNPMLKRSEDVVVQGEVKVVQHEEEEHAEQLRASEPLAASRAVAGDGPEAARGSSTGAACSEAVVPATGVLPTGTGPRPAASSLRRRPSPPPRCSPPPRARPACSGPGRTAERLRGSTRSCVSRSGPPRFGKMPRRRAPCSGASSTLLLLPVALGLQRHATPARAEASPCERPAARLRTAGDAASRRPRGCSLRCGRAAARLLREVA